MNYNYLLTLAGPVLSGLFVYFMLSYLMPNGINLTLSFIISVLIFGLTSCYVVKDGNTPKRKDAQNNERKAIESNVSRILFILIYIALLAVIAHSSSYVDTQLFINWEKITPVQILGITSAIAFSFFLPGYALVMALDKNKKLTILPKFLLAYIFSILIAGLGGYLSASSGHAISTANPFFFVTYIVILLFWLKRINALRREFYHLPAHLWYQSLSKIKASLTDKYSQYIVFSSLFALVILYTYYLNHGQIVMDQWYHHGRAILFGSGLFRDLGPSDVWYPPFFSAFLAAFFNLSGLPSVNAYVAIGFLNIVPVFAFYYFFTNCIPKDKKRSALLASTLFMLSSGFGWIYAINAATFDQGRVTSDESTLKILGDATEKTFDIGTPTTFIGVNHPDVTSPLIILALPAGFTLLGLISQVKLYNLKHFNNNSSPSSKSRFFTIFILVPIVTAVSLLGILSNDEFYIFIITASIAIVILFSRLAINFNYSIFFVSFLVAMCLVILLDAFTSSSGFYTSRILFGVPLIIISFLFVSVSWALYIAILKIKISNNFAIDGLKARVRKITHVLILEKIVTLKFLNDYQIQFLKLSLGIVIVSAVAYYYLFAVLVWDELSLDEIHLQIDDFSTIPWYLYPIKFGLTGLLGIAFILSYLFKKFEKGIIVFGILALVALLTGPYYNEHRFSKYIMSGMAAFAAILIYQTISSHILEGKLKLRPLMVGLFLGIVVTSSSLSIFMYVGYIELSDENSKWIEDGRRDFPTTSEIQLLKFLNNKIIDSKAYNVGVVQEDIGITKGFITKLYGFTPIPREKLLQIPLTLNSSTLEGLYNLLNSSDTRYIVLQKKDIIDYTGKESITYSNSSRRDFNTHNVISFVLDNFPKIYEDKNYIVLEVLPLRPPSAKGSNVAVVYQREFDELRSVSTKNLVLPTNSGLFGLQTPESKIESNTYYSNGFAINKLQGQNKYLSTTAASIILGANVESGKSKNITLWSQPAWNTNDSGSNRTTINYIELNFKIIDIIRGENKSERKESDKFGAGVWWEHDNKDYRLSISKDGLELSESPSNKSISFGQTEQSKDDNEGKQLSSLILFQNQEIKRQQGIWYNLKILLIKNNIEIYVNDILRAKVPARDYFQSPSIEKNTTVPSISRVGVSTYYSKSEFQPIILGQTSELPEQSSLQYQKLYYKHYYPLSILALSKIKYDSFVDGDMSAFSRKYVVLPFDITQYHENEASKYLEFVKKGGSLIVIHSENKFEGELSTLLPIKLGSLAKFDSITLSNASKLGEKKYTLNISGTARNIEINPNSNLTVKSYYMNKDMSNKSQSVAPFAVEKNYGHGKIIFVNAIGYFDALFGNSLSSDKLGNNDKNLYFATLSKVAPIIGIPHNNVYVDENLPHIPSIPTSRIIGDIKISPMQIIIINSSSLTFPDSDSIGKKPASYNLSAKLLTITTNSLQKISFSSHKVLNDTFTVNKTDDDFNFLVKKKSNDNHGHYSFKKVIMKDLKLYGGQFQIIIKVTNSSSPLYLPTSSSYNDYIEMSIRRGFDLTIKFPNNNSSYAQLDILDKGDDKDSFKTIRVSGNKHDNTGSSNNTGYIFFHNVGTDVPIIRHISTLMKSPEIKIMQVGDIGAKESPGEETVALSYDKIFPDSNPTKIQKENGEINLKLDHVDNSNKPFNRGIERQFITYLKNDIQIIKDDTTKIPAHDQNFWFSELISKKLGDISEDARQHGIEVPWQKVIVSTPSVVTGIALVIAMVMAMIFIRYKIIKFHRVNEK